MVAEQKTEAIVRNTARLSPLWPPYTRTSGGMNWRRLEGGKKQSKKDGRGKQTKPEPYKDRKSKEKTLFKVYKQVIGSEGKLRGLQRAVGHAAAVSVGTRPRWSTAADKDKKQASNSAKCGPACVRRAAAAQPA